MSIVLEDNSLIEKRNDRLEQAFFGRERSVCGSVV